MRELRWFPSKLDTDKHVRYSLNQVVDVSITSLNISLMPR